MRNEDWIGLGIGVGGALIEEQIRREQQQQRYIGDFGGFRCREGLVPVRTKSGKIRCVREQ
jgi:hypothetical protein